jgi:molybdenum cofactor cytidylyltransferase
VSGSAAAVVLAAGASTRLGEAKQLAMLGGEALLERAVRLAREAGCAPVVVVLGAEAERISSSCKLGDAMVAINEQWCEGMAASIQSGLRAVRAGIAAIGEVNGVVLMACDQPAVTAEHLRALMATGEVTASEYAWRRGVPAYFPATAFAALGELTGDAGARELLRGARAIPLPGGELDIDTPEALDEARRLFA